MKNPQKRAYSLVEQAISIAILTIILMMILIIGEYKNRENQQRDNLKKIAQIDKAIIAKYLDLSLSNKAGYYHLFPCPSSLSSKKSNDDFGVSAFSNDNYSCININGIKDVGNNYYLGAIPTQTLLLEDSLAFDDWGRHYSFIVNNQLLALYEEEIPQQNLDEILYFIISHGPNGYGAYNQSANQIAYKNAVQEELYQIYGSLEFSLDKIRNRPTSLNKYDDIIFYRTVRDFLGELSGGEIFSVNECEAFKQIIISPTLKNKVEASCLS